MCLRSRSILRPLLDSGTSLPKTRPCSKCRIGLAPCFAGRGVFQRATVSVNYSEDIARALEDGSAAILATRLPVASNCRTRPLGSALDVAGVMSRPADQRIG